MNEGKIKAADANLRFGRLGIGVQSNQYSIISLIPALAIGTGLYVNVQMGK